MKEKKVIYEPHPVSADRKKELIGQGYKIIDAVFEPAQEKPAKQAKVAKDEKWPIHNNITRQIEGW